MDLKGLLIENIMENEAIIEKFSEKEYKELIEILEKYYIPILLKTVNSTNENLLFNRLLNFIDIIKNYNIHLEYIKKIFKTLI